MNFNDYNINRLFSGLDNYSDNQGNELIKEIEKRYSFENEMIKAVSTGNAKALNSVINVETFMVNVEARVDDRLRNLKNYMIIYNTLLRKGAEVGNVHPFYIHGTSAAFARRIEESKSEKEIEKLWSEMATAYCNLVREHASKGYSPLVQNIVMLIDADLSEKLTLSILAEKFNVNKSYLSSLFKKDTGFTLTEYVNDKRIEKAKSLLVTTGYQIQDIAHFCGFSDVNYFVKVFKKKMGKTPVEYRNENKV